MENKVYLQGDYVMMNISQKIEFIHKVHTGELDIWDEYGNESFIWDDFHTVSGELLRHPEWFGLENLLQVMEITNECCFELSWQEQLSEMIYFVMMHHGRAGIAYYLQHLQDVPEEGHFHGCHIPIQWLISDDENYDMLKEVLLNQDSQTKQTFLEILEAIEPFVSREEEKNVRYQERKEELKGICC